MLGVERYGIYKERLPLPFRLDHVNCYAINGTGGWWLVDAGPNDESTRQAWLDFLEKHKIKAKDIKGIYLTHYHPDHYGAAGWLQQLSGALVYISSVDARAVGLYWKQGEQIFAAVSGLFVENGMPEKVADAVLENMLQTLSSVRPHPEITILAGSEVQLGDYTYRAVSPPGHSDGHVCFYNQDNKIMLSGDHLLSKITSNIGLWPFANPNPLKNFLNSLSKNHWLQDCLALPAHGDPFANVGERVNQLKTHHYERLDLIRSAAARGATAYDVCRQVFGEDLSLHEVRFAMAETLAHLVFLVQQGELQVMRRSGVIIYSDLERQ